MLILYAFIIDEIRATKEHKEYEQVFVKIYVLTIQPQPIVSTHGTHRTAPSTLRSPTFTTDIASKKKRKHDFRETTTEAIENIAKVQEKLEEEIQKMVEGEDNKESYASEFTDSMFQDDDDSGDRIEPGSHKEHSENVDDDDDDDKTEKEKKDDIKNDEKANDEEKKDETGSMETRKEKMQTPISSPTRSLRKNISLDKTLSKKLSICLIYLNNKDEKKVMYLTKIVKLYDTMLERVLKEVKLKIFKSKPWKKPPLLGGLDLDILKAFKREISKRLRHCVQMRM
nr:hypothetical protein [Tanacetum cinerariifolium]